MSANDLHHFIATLEADHELSRITAEVDPLLEIAAITDRVCKQQDGGRALLFEQPAGSTFPVATNLFGSEKRTCQALGVTTLGELTARMNALLGQIVELDVPTLDRQIAALPEFSRFAPHADMEPDPSLVGMNPPNLAHFPFLQSWPGDGEASGHQRYITLPQVFTCDPDGATPNCGLYRVQLRSGLEVAIQWKAGSGGARHAEQYRLAGKAMPVAIVLGGDPATLFSAMFPLPGDLDEITFAGFLRNSPLTTAPCRSIPLHVPTGVEVVIEGYVEPGETVMEGPFGNHTGFYSPAAPAALMRITAISHRLDAVIPATLVGPPPMEDCWMARAWERLLLAFLHRLVPEINDIHFPAEWIFHQSAIISLDNPQPGVVRNISGQLWALPWFRSARLLLFVTADTEPLTLSRSAWRGINMTDTNDIIHDQTTARIAIDATGSHMPRAAVHVSDATATLVAGRWKEYGLP
ncbi:MAG: UbiD family decarboxylase [Desulfuromonadaceae bacterium]|nr:UbiD family decarboxylase [Desulfuromonadaceae bacterium]MDD2848460.1 UbiD family decarboxylase [Desulfuromonadaceae bacterium]MDD4129911.1 UbiD family decarboxylase [Desulfuromonadaceae bacterium]